MKHIHFIGICGVAMSALALALKKKGYKITGSDAGFHPPISTHLKENKVDYYPGWHPEKMIKNGVPDLVVVGNVASSTNPEWLYVQEHKLKYLSYPEVIAEYFVKKNSIVCAGTYGKSTSAALLTWILKENDFDPSYMFGGISLNNIPAAEITDSDWSILEGDEYKSARWDNQAKFNHYSPTHLLLSSVIWDHADLYPTAESYVAAFANLLTKLPANGLLVLSAKVIHDQPEFKNLAKCPIVTYGRTPDNDYQYTNVKLSKDGTDFDIIHKGETYHVHTDQLGDYMADNMAGCFALSHQIGIEPEDIIRPLQTFKNIKRRLEKRLAGKITVFDDIAHSPKKAEAVLRSVKKIYSGRVFAIFEPNSGNRQTEAIPGYENKFTSADVVIIPRLTHIKQDAGKPKPLDGQALAKVIAKTHEQVKYIDKDNELIQYLLANAKPDDVMIFLGSHGFRGMIEDLVSRLSRIS